MKKSCLLFLLLITGCMVCRAQSLYDTGFALVPGEGWWGGAVSFGHLMPFGKNTFSFNLNSDKSYNQNTPLLISNKGRWLWSDKGFQYTFRNDSLIISDTYSDILAGTNGTGMRDAYTYVSKRFFPATGTWPDSLLISAPQYNLWIELMYNPNQRDVLDYAKKVLSHGYPEGVLMIDDNWSSYYGGFDFDKGRFPDAKKMLGELHSMGFKVMVWICPFITPDSKEYRELAQRKMLLLDNCGNQNLAWADAQKPLLIEWWNGYSACLDLTNPETEKWLGEKLDALQREYGVDGYKLDAGDAYFYTSPQMVSYKKVSANDHSMAWAKVGLDYKLNEYRAMWKMGGQPLVQRLSDKSHSWDDLQMLIPQTIAQQLSGYTFTCPDMIGGGSYASFLPGSTIDQKLIVRSAQCHALMPMMQFSAAPWRILDEQHHLAVKKAVAVRQRHMPYILNTLGIAAISGMPALKPLEFNYPGRGYEMVMDQFLLGDTLMIAPVVTANDERKVIFPPGKWKYNSKTYTGPAEKIFKVALDEVLVFELQQ